VKAALKACDDGARREPVMNRMPTNS